ADGGAAGIRFRVLSLALIDLYRHVRARSGLDVVLAGTAMGPHASHLRSKPKSARSVRHQKSGVGRRAGRFRGVAFLRGMRMGHSLVCNAVKPESQTVRTDELSAIRDVSVFCHHGFGRVAGEDAAEIAVSRQVCVDYAMVQYLTLMSQGRLWLRIA